MKYYFKAFKNYAKCGGRATRKEVWLFGIIHFVIEFTLLFLDGVFFDSGYMTMIYLLASICPIICLQIRRLHDVGKSGFWLWAAIMPVLRWYLVYLLYFKGSVYTLKANTYGSQEDYLYRN